LPSTHQYSHGLVPPSVGNPHLAAIDDDRNDSVRVCVHVSCTHVCESMCACSLFSYGGVHYTYLQHSHTHTNTCHPPFVLKVWENGI